MGMYASKSSIAIFDVVGESPQEDVATWVGEQLRENAFMSIDNTTDQESFGWVSLDDADDSDFVAGDSYRRDNYIAFSLRRDQRKIPSVLKKREFQSLCNKYLNENPNYKKVPKQIREEYSELATSLLLAKTLPVPSFTDAVWNTETDRLYFFSTSTGALDLFESLFKVSFPGYRIQPRPPITWARQLTPEPLEEELQALTAGLPETMLGQMAGTGWLSEDFFSWLLAETIDGSGEFRVTTPGLAGMGHPFVAYLHNRILLKGSVETGEKITVTGDQGGFQEVRSALQNSKNISEASIVLEQEEESWGFTLKGELFHLGSFATPPPLPAQEDGDDRESLFYEKIALIEKGIQLFASLFAEFIQIRLTDRWQDHCKKMESLLIP